MARHKITNRCEKLGIKLTSLTAKYNISYTRLTNIMYGRTKDANGILDIIYNYLSELEANSVHTEDHKPKIIKRKK